MAELFRDWNPVKLCRIDDNGKVISSQRDEPRPVEWYAVQRDRDYGTRAPAQFGLDLIQIQIACGNIDIHSHRDSAGPENCRPSCDEGECRQYNAITGSNPERAKRQFESVKPTANTYTIGNPRLFGERRLKARYVVATYVRAALQHCLKSRKHHTGYLLPAPVKSCHPYATAHIYPREARYSSRLDRMSQKPR